MSSFVRASIVACVFAAGGVAPVLVAQGAMPRLAAVEDLRVGSPDVATQRFIAVRSIRAMSNGAFAVLTAFSPGGWKLQVFGSTGAERWAHTFPSELAGVATYGDTIAVFVGGSVRQVSLFLAGRDAPIGTIDVPAPSPGQNVSLVGSTSGRPVLVTSTTAIPDGALTRALAQPVYEVRPLIGAAPGSSPLLTRRDSTARAVYQPSATQKSTISSTLPWSPRLSITASRGEVYFASGLTYDIDVYDLTGRNVRRITVPADVRPISRQMHDAWLAEWRATPFGASLPEESFQAIRALPSPPHRPIVRGVLVSETGDIAVSRADLSASPVGNGDSIRVDILGADGRPRGRVVLPPGLVLESFGGSHLFASSRDSTRVAGRNARGGAPLPLYQVVRYRIGAPIPR